ncbi:hypothetical protein D3C78_1657210 [compost metagenome]
MLAGRLTLGPGVLQIEQHDHAELGGHPRQGDEADASGHRQVVSEQIEEPHPAGEGEW